MGPWYLRRDSSLPYQEWKAFPPDAIVQARNVHGEDVIAPAGALWWGYESEFGMIADGVIVKARRLDKPRPRK